MLVTRRRAAGSMEAPETATDREPTEGVGGDGTTILEVAGETD